MSACYHVCGEIDFVFSYRKNSLGRMDMFCNDMLRHGDILVMFRGHLQLQILSVTISRSLSLLDHTYAVLSAEQSSYTETGKRRTFTSGIALLCLN